MKQKLPIVAIVGRPNVGKSTLFNRLCGKRLAITSEILGTTRDRLYEEISWRGKTFILADTAGIGWGKEDLAVDIKDQIQLAAKEADLIIFLGDITVGLTADDQRALRQIRKVNKKVILAVNKVDNQNLKAEASEFYKLGLGEPIPIAALAGKNIGTLLDEVAANIKKGTKIPDDDIFKVVILGRPNVGKSSLFNQLIKEERAIVSDIPGTTRDVLSTKVRYDNADFLILDTAGLRKRGKIEKGIEKYSVLRALKALEEADLALLVIDASGGVVAQDLHVAGFAKEKNKAVILVVNKWDLADEDQDVFLKKMRYQFKFLAWMPIIFVSALTGKNVAYIFGIVKETKEKMKKRITTARFNDFVEELVLTNPPAARKVRAKIFYATQTKDIPPTFVFFTNYPEEIHFSYIRFLEKRIREEFDFSGVPIKVIMRKKK